MASLRNRALFFTTSPRTPSKMLPEIQLLCEMFGGYPWNSQTQEAFMDQLAQSDFFAGKGSPKNKAFSARDRINRAPKALGFVDLKPGIALTAAGRELIYGKRPQEIFLRQLLKFQLPSPYHVESKKINGTFHIRPYLEVLRLLRELEYITFDEFKIFVVQLTDYRDYEKIKAKILDFRTKKIHYKGKYQKFANEAWTDAVMSVYEENIRQGRTKTRETQDASLGRFIATKKRNFYDYADAGFRYLRYTGLVSISHKGRSIAIFKDKLSEVDDILASVSRDPVYINDEAAYKKYLFDAALPVLPVDNADRMIDVIMRMSTYTRRDLLGMTVEALKDLHDELARQHRQAIIDTQVEQLKSYALYSEIIDTYNEIIADEYYDAPLMFEYNTWRAMTMLDGGSIRGNFNIDDAGQPLSTAAGNMPDIECDYPDFALSVEVTLQSGQRQYESEGEPVARHYGRLRKASGKETYCLFIAPAINSSSLAHFYGLNHLPIALYGGKSKIIPLDLGQFMQLIENSYSYNGQPSSADVRRFLDQAIEQCDQAVDERDWQNRIQSCVNAWLTA